MFDINYNFKLTNDKYLLKAYYVPNIVLDVWNTLVNKLSSKTSLNFNYKKKSRYMKFQQQPFEN